MQQENPYSSILHTIRSDSDDRTVTPWRIGRVAALSPLAIEIGGFPLSGRELLINEELLRDAPLIVGDQVVLLQSGDGQQYVALCKVVTGG